MANPLLELLQAKFAERTEFSVLNALGEMTLTVPSDQLLQTMQNLRDDPTFLFDQLIDLAGMDYLEFGGDNSNNHPARYAVVYHLLSLPHNRRLRVRTYCDQDDFPQLSSVCEVWAAANWYEREAFDLFGMVFHGHQDLRRILTDYGFVGHPFRKDFPISGHVEMRYDPAKKRVVYVPVSIPPREVTPRIVREESFAKGRDSNG